MNWSVRISAYVFAAIFLLGVAARLPAEHPKSHKKKGRQLIPVLSSAMDSPEFVLDYTNETNTTQDIMELLGASSIVLDGIEYRRQVIVFMGNANLQPGRTHSFKIGLHSYLPRDGWQKHGYSKKLKRWRWKTPLKSGRHTLSVKFGNKQYETITFDWDGDLPLLYE